ncbi:DUF2815 family protein [Mesorhizobium sp. M0184]|uniref:ssDNA-binding protein n=1 Tax=Mesorhizobium sp. M0184 TaxID=2956906 RepID=UPI00333DD817
MSIEQKSDGRTVQLKRVRLSFTDSLKDKKATVEDGKPKHSANMILESAGKEYDANRAKVAAALKEASKQAFKNEDAYKSIAEDNPKRVCYRKGERFKNKEGAVYAGYEGNYAISAGGPGGGARRPKLLDRHKRPVEEKDILDVFYGGAYADVIVSFFGTEKGGRGIFASIEAIRSHQEGDRMGGGVYVDADDFDDLEDDGFDSGPSSEAKKPAAKDDFDF